MLTAGSCRWWPGCRLPGHTDSPDRLWEALLRGDDLVTEIPADRWDDEYRADPNPRALDALTACGTLITSKSRVLGIGERSDSDRSAAPPAAETSWEAMEHGGLTPNQMASRTGFSGWFIPTIMATPILEAGRTATREARTKTNQDFAVPSCHGRR